MQSIQPMLPAELLTRSTH